MIELIKSGNYEFCLNCKSEKDLLDLRIKSRNSNCYMVITLCPNCLKVLKEKIEEKEK